MELKLNSRFAQYIRDFIRLKRASGHPYVQCESIFNKFDAMVLELFPDAETVTAPMLNKWIEIAGKGVSRNALIRMLTPINQFCRFLNTIGIGGSQIPAKMIGGEIKHEAYIFSREELQRFFCVVDHLTAHSAYGPVMQLTVPTVFRLMLTTGIRSGEIWRLKYDDVRFALDEIIILQSKGHPRRVVVPHDEMLQELRIYDQKINGMFPNRNGFFVKENGNALINQDISRWFRKFWPLSQAGFDSSLKADCSSRDFRHTFATECIIQWLEQGRESRAIMPYLRNYMGHSSYESTYYYLHLVKAMRPDLAAQIDEALNAPIPEPAPYIEEN